MSEYRDINPAVLEQLIARMPEKAQTKGFAIALAILLNSGQTEAIRELEKQMEELPTIKKYLQRERPE